MNNITDTNFFAVAAYQQCENRNWLEDQSTEDESEALETLFSEYLLPWCGAFLGKVEAHATTPFWRTMAPLTRDAISAMWDELEEDSEE